MLHAVISAGADAAYLGMGELNARRGADNFDNATLREACEYAHLRGSRIYVAMNTIVLPEEMAGALKTARACVEAGADAFIVQDLGLALALKREAPSARLHASTQMSIHSRDGIEALAQLGFERVTLARELSLGEIENLCECASALGIEVETFAHGALCVCYSGQCLMSSMIGGRSANRGLCAQACRLPYRLVDMRDEEKRLKSPGDHLLSPKDLCLVDDVGSLMDAGVASLKIEGRMKSPEYAGTVVSVYREALDAANGSEEVDERLREEFRTRLGSVFSRGFTTAYLDGKRGNDIMSYQRPNNRGQFVGRIKSVGKGYIDISCEKKLAEGDLLEVWTGRGNFTVKAEELSGTSGKVVRLAVPDGDMASGKRNGASQARSNDRVFRVRSADAVYDDDSREPRIPVSGCVRLRIGSPLEATFWLEDDGSAVARRLASRLSDRKVSASASGPEVEAARTRAVSKSDVIEHVDRLGQTPYRLVGLEVDMDEGVGIGFSQLHHVRTEALDALTQEILSAMEGGAFAGIAAEGEGTVLRQSSPGENVHWTFSFAAESARGPSPSAAIPCRTTPADIRIAVVATNPDCARVARRAGATDILVSALNYRRGQAQQEGMLMPEPSQAPFPKKCTIMIPSIAHDAVGTSREVLLDEDVWANVAEGQSVLVDGIGALHHAIELGCQVEIGQGLPLVNRDALLLAQAFGASRVWLSPELNIGQIAQLASHGGEGIPRLGAKVFGAQELMVTEHCMLMSQGDCNERCQDCSRRKVPFALEDRKGYIFPVSTDSLGRSHLYNSVELDNVSFIPELIDAGVTDFMVDATLMSPEQCAQATGRVAKAIELWAQDGSSVSKLHGTTTGHLHRGVR